jgi:hypothetical protein
MSKVFNNKSTYCWTLLTLVPGNWLIVEHSWHWYIATDLFLNTLDIDTGSLTYCWTLLTLIPGHWLIVEYSWHWYRVTNLLLNTLDIDTWFPVSMSRVFNNKSVTRYQCKECSTISQLPGTNVKSVQQLIQGHWLIVEHSTLIQGHWLIAEYSWHWYRVTALLLNTLDIDTGSLTYCWTLNIDTGSLTYCWILLTLIQGHWLIVEHSWHWYLVTAPMSRVFNNKSVTRYQRQVCSTISQWPGINVKSVQQ